MVDGVRTRWWLVAVAIIAFSGCCGTQGLSATAPDSSPPALHVGTAGLNPDIEVDTTVSEPRGARASLSADVIIGAQAQDNESGIRSVELTLDTSVTCRAGAVASHRQWAVTTRQDAPCRTTSPAVLNELVTLKGADVKHLCPAGQVLSVVVDVYATAVNGRGASVASPKLTLRYDSDPDKLRIALLNLYEPGLAKDDGSDVGQPVTGEPGKVKAEVWSALDNWATTKLAHVDVVFLTEVRHRPHLARLSQKSGLPHYVVYQDQFYTDVAILSRYPLSDLVVTGEADFFDGANAIRLVEATMTVGASRFYLLASHFPWRPVAEARRKKYGDMIEAKVAAKGLPALIGGDFNGGYAFSHPDITTDCDDAQRVFLAAPTFEPKEPASCSAALPSDHVFIDVTVRRK